MTEFQKLFTGTPQTEKMRQEEHERQAEYVAQVEAEANLWVCKPCWLGIEGTFDVAKSDGKDGVRCCECHQTTRCWRTLPEGENP